MKSIGRVEIPQEAFISALTLGNDLPVRLGVRLGPPEPPHLRNARRRCRRIRMPQVESRMRSP